jgi:hypothetical protein
MRSAAAVPHCVLPAVDRAVVPAQGAVPDDLAGRRVEFRDDIASRSGFAIDQSARRECLHHLVHHRRRDAEEPLEVRSVGARP